ncbi:MAG: hypothetical protein M3430_02295 [Acidobacteriota bacterium]|nr:hypothetical protein [Acidobacteriota bacterium]
MLTNLTNGLKTRGTAGQTTHRSFTVVMPGAAWSGYCLSSIPSDSSVGGVLKNRPTAPESLEILKDRQLQK